MKPYFWALSTISLLFGVLMFLGPSVVAKLNDMLSRNLALLDKPIMRGRYLFGLMLLVSSYLLFVLGLH